MSGKKARWKENEKAHFTTRNDHHSSTCIFDVIICGYKCNNNSAFKHIQPCVRFPSAVFFDIALLTPNPPMVRAMKERAAVPTITLFGFFSVIWFLIWFYLNLKNAPFRPKHLVFWSQQLLKWWRTSVKQQLPILCGNKNVRKKRKKLHLPKKQSSRYLGPALGKGCGRFSWMLWRNVTGDVWLQQHQQFISIRNDLWTGFFFKLL